MIDPKQSLFILGRIAKHLNDANLVEKGSLVVEDVEAFTDFIVTRMDALSQSSTLFAALDSILVYLFFLLKECTNATLTSTAIGAITDCHFGDATKLQMYSENELILSQV